MNDEDLQARAAAYAIGALDPAEARAFEALMAERADLRTLVRELQEVSALLAAGTPPAAPRAELRDRVLAAARTEAPRHLTIEPRRRIMPAARLAWAAAIAGLLLAGAQTLRLQRRAADLSRAAQELNSVAQRRDVLEERLAAILDGHTTMSVMRPTGAEAGPRYGAQVFWRGDQQTWLVHVFDLPRLPAGAVYQLW